MDVSAGEWLVSHRQDMERGEALWLERLAEFDMYQEWAADGQYSCIEWLMFRLKMARATAYEKVQVAHQLRRRPIIASAFGDGRLSYSAVRVILRIDDPDPEVDSALVTLAEAGTVADVEKAVRFYQLHADQHRPPADFTPKTSLRWKNNLDGTATIELILPEIEAQELLTIMQAFIDRAEGAGESKPGASWPGGAWSAERVDESAAADCSADRDASPAEPVDESARADCRLGPADEAPISAKRAQAVLDMARVALQHIDGPPAAGADRYTVHLVIEDWHAFMLDGTPIDDEVANRVACDASTVTHLVGENGEPLALGRKTREWSTAQRRAIMIRDGGTCRFPGCNHRLYVDIHHHYWWSRGGLTDVENGYVACSFHHDLIHKHGYLVEGEPNGVLTFYRPNGMLIGSTMPRRRRRHSANQGHSLE